MKSLILLFVIAIAANLYSQETGTFTDERNGQIYKWVKIEEQVWMAENLNFEADSVSWCYKDSAHYCDTYGRLYTWDAAMKLCPEGWYLPSQNEWVELMNNLGGHRKSDDPAYVKMISGEDTGFNALLGGWRMITGKYNGINSYGLIWSSTEISASKAWYCYLVKSSESAYMYRNDKRTGISVRCIKKIEE
jgi:uncharacterized protein (TIGR02145 family)